MKYKIHKFDLRMSKDKDKFEDFLNTLTGEVTAIIPHVTIAFFWVHYIDYLWIVEREKD